MQVCTHGEVSHALQFSFLTWPFIKAQQKYGSSKIRTLRWMNGVTRKRQNPQRRKWIDPQRKKFKEVDSNGLEMCREEENMLEKELKNSKQYG